MYNNYSPITYTNNSDKHVVIGDGGSLLFSGTSLQCEGYINSHPLQYSSFSSYSILKPGQTLEIKYSGSSSSDLWG